MIRSLGRLIGLSLLGQWVDSLPRVQAAWIRLGVVLVVFTAPAMAVLAGAMSYSDVWWWLWLDAFTVGAWTIVALAARRASRQNLTLFVVHYFAMFTLLPAVVYALVAVPKLPLTGGGIDLVILGVASLVLHGWLTRRLWWRADALRGNGSEWSLMLLPYLRLAVVYAGLFLPLSVAGLAQGDTRPVSGPDIVRATLILLAAKLALEVVLAVVHLVRAHQGRPTRA